MAGYRHGIYISEEPTSLVLPSQADKAMTVSYFGFHLKDHIWRNYRAPEVIYSQFALYACAPVVIINVLSPKKHKQSIANKKIKVEGKSSFLEVDRGAVGYGQSEVSGWSWDK